MSLASEISEGFAAVAARFNTIKPYAAYVPGTGSGTVDITHNLNTLVIDASFQRHVAGVATGNVLLNWWPLTVNTMRVDFDTYARAANEFYVKVSRG